MTSFPSAQSTAVIQSGPGPASPSRLHQAQGVYVTVHGHFYQPPRENPYLDAIQRQPGAAPFHDWNERIYHECYRPNAFARVYDDRGDIVEIVNNFEYFSFNIGPTLLSWLAHQGQDVYGRILAGDRASLQRLGHGNAIAQAYNHMILPLATERDKRTQIRWGMADFRHHFGRDPEGMWLAETAVDYPTVSALIDEGIRFIILAPSQAQRCRPLIQPDQPDQLNLAGLAGQAADWQLVDGGQIDPTRPYRCFVGDRFLDIFFYDGPISRAMGFEDLLGSTASLADRLGLAVHHDERPAQLISVATDGETFGHHKSGTEKCLAYAFTQEFSRRDWTVTNYAHYLSLCPPTWEVQLKPVTAWSCAHGVDRWQDNCGCAQSEGYHQKWRRPLRNSLDWLRDQLSDLYETEAAPLLEDPWAARDAYIEVIQDRSRAEDFLARFGRRHPAAWEGSSASATSHTTLDPLQKSRALCLLEMQRQTQLMYTSCGWFFEELSRPEGVQILCYAARALALAQSLTGTDLEPEFLQRLALAPSNRPQYGHGAEVYRQRVQPSQVVREQLVAHFAMARLQEYGAQSAALAAAPGAIPGANPVANPAASQGHPTLETVLSEAAALTQSLYCYDVAVLDEQRQQLGATRLLVGQLRLRSRLTNFTNCYGFAVLHTGGLDFHCRVLPLGEGEEHQANYRQLKQSLLAIDLGHLSQVVLALAEQFAKGKAFDLSDLLTEVRQRMMTSLSGQTLGQLEQLYDRVYRENQSLIQAFHQDGLALPQALQVAAQVALAQQVRQGARSLLQDWQHQQQLSPAGLAQLSALEQTAAAVHQLGLGLTAPDLPPLLVALLEQLMAPVLQALGQQSRALPQADTHLTPLERLLRLSREQLCLGLDLSRLQEQLYDLLRPLPVSQWPEAARRLARELGLAVPQPHPGEA